ncbi:MAG: bifunctional precorrin-2 dehydrogenase/sirohydrochlorin ferrochelatase [Sedimentisphaerales bacterium]|nr:bifunctional precorrin-2 dehydrogenase/sirohydrochlorin ferrochelatase [Sedimentisphaerales bacterium]
MVKYPIFLKMEGRRAVVIGAGTVALRKVQILLETGAHVIVIAERVDPELEVLCQKNKNAQLVKSPYSKEYLAGATLAIAATNDRQINKQVYHDCQNLTVLCNVVDDPDLCDFFAPAVLQRGDLQIAISTNGHCPSYAAHIRRKLEEIFTDTHARFLAELERLRAKVISEVPAEADRKILMGKLTEDDSLHIFMTNGTDKWRQYANKLITKKQPDEVRSF